MYKDLIVKALESRVGAKGVPKALEDYGGDIASKGADSFLNKLFYKGNSYPEMMFGHAIDDKLLKSRVLSGDNKLINPSMFITEASERGLPPNAYGNVVFTGDKDLVNPALSNIDAYDRHAWTGRVPRVKSHSDGKRYIYDGDSQLGEATTDMLSEYVGQSRSGHLQGGLLSSSPSALSAGAAKNVDSLAELVKNESGTVPAYRSFNAEQDLRYIADKTDVFYDDIIKDYEMYKRSGVSDLMNRAKHTGLGRNSYDLVEPDQVKHMYDLLDQGVSPYKEVKYKEPFELSRFNTAFIPAKNMSSTADREMYMIDKMLHDQLSEQGLKVVPYRSHNYDLTGGVGTPDMDKYIPVDIGYESPGPYDTITNEVLRAFLNENKGKNRWTSRQLLSAAGALPVGGVLSGLLGGGNEEYL